MNKEKTISLLLRVGIGFTFLFAGVDGLWHPDNWIGYMPQMMGQFMPITAALFVFSIFEIVLAVWLFSGWKIVYSAGVSALMLLGIIISTPSEFLITFRDIPILLSAIALIVLHR